MWQAKEAKLFFSLYLFVFLSEYASVLYTLRTGIAGICVIKKIRSGALVLTYLFS